jgi:hypothetical protein
MIYYTYAYLRVDRTPYYIGKGKGNRAYRRRYKGEIKSPKDKSRIIFLKQDLTEEEAFRHEKYMISVFGRKDLGTGILHNRTDGGEGCSGAKRSEETKLKMRTPKKTTINMKKPKSEEHKKKIGLHRKGKKHTEEARKKMSDAQVRRIITDEFREKIQKSRMGRKHSEETKQKMREKALLREELKRNNK